MHKVLPFLLLGEPKMVEAGQLQEELSIGTMDSTPTPDSSLLPHDLQLVLSESSKP